MVEPAGSTTSFMPKRRKVVNPGQGGFRNGERLIGGMVVYLKLGLW